MKNRWWWIALLSGTAMAACLARVNISVIGDPIMKEFGLSQIQIGRVFSAFLLGYAFCARYLVASWPIGGARGGYSLSLQFPGSSQPWAWRS